MSVWVQAQGAAGQETEKPIGAHMEGIAARLWHRGKQQLKNHTLEFGIKPPGRQEPAETKDPHKPKESQNNSVALSGDQGRTGVCWVCPQQLACSFAAHTPPARAASSSHFATNFQIQHQ